MTSTTTPTVGFTIPVVGTNEPWSSAVYDANWQIADTEFLARRTADTALAARATNLEGGSGRSGAAGGADYVVNTLTDLDAISTAKVGDTAFMVTPGTGIDALHWEAFSGTGATIDWRIRDTVVAATKANLVSFIAAVAALVADLTFQVGAQALVKAPFTPYIFTSNVGGLLINAAPLRMIPAGSTGVTVDATNGFATSTAQTAVTLGTVGSPAMLDPFTDYNVFYDFTGSSATTTLQAQFLDSSGTAISTGTLYDIYRHTSFNSTVTNTPLMAQNNIPLSGGLAGASFRHRGRLSIRAARDAAVKVFESHTLVTAVPGVAATGGQVNLDGVLNSTQLLTGISFIASGTTPTITALEVYVEAIPK